MMNLLEENRAQKPRYASQWMSHSIITTITTGVKPIRSKKRERKKSFPKKLNGWIRAKKYVFSIAVTSSIDQQHWQIHFTVSQFVLS